MESLPVYIDPYFPPSSFQFHYRGYAVLEYNRPCWQVANPVSPGQHPVSVYPGQYPGSAAWR